MEYFTYVIQSEIDGRLYKGQTEDINIRIAQHNAGKTKSTKGYLPLKLVYFEKFYTNITSQFNIRNTSNYITLEPLTATFI